MVELPPPTAVTLKLIALVPTAIIKDAGTAATPALLDASETLRLDAAGAESVRVIVPFAPVICSDDGDSAMLEPSSTTVVAEFKPFAVAVIVADPWAMPYRLG